MKKILFLIFCVCTCVISFSQVIPLYNNTTSYHYEPEVLDGKQTNLVLAFSMRKLFIDYEGPLIRLRRSVDNTIKDFYPAAVSGIVDVDAIDEWRNGNDVYVVIWYNQNGTSIHAMQNNIVLQPQFFSDPDRPYFIGDGIDNHLIVSASTKLDLTNNGAEATILTVIKATQKAQYNFGYQNPASSADRWSAHINWSGSKAYFDLGFCCGQTREINNSVNVNLFKAYTIVRASTLATIKINGTTALTATYNSSWRLSDNAKLLHIKCNSWGKYALFDVKFYRIFNV